MAKVIDTDGIMADPPHPGEVLKGLHMAPAGLTIKAVSERLGVERKALSRLINGHTGITADMAIRLGKAFSTSANLWLNMQRSYDLWHASIRLKRDAARIRPFTTDDYRPSA